MNILIADDEKDIVEMLSYNLKNEGFTVVTAHDGEEALEKLTAKIDLIILDVLMPKMDGYQVCAEIRRDKKYKNTPIIFLTAKGSEIDEIHGLSLGADDYIQKPISPKKLIARVKTNLRRKDILNNSFAETKEIKSGRIIINKEKHIVRINGEEIFFPKKEFEILAFLAANPEKVIHRDKILNEIWGTDIFVIERTVDVHIRKIREKLGDQANRIETIKGVGYRFKNEK